MEISLEHIGKRFQRQWVFKDISISFRKPQSCALLGPNGSGKSTLLRIIAGIQAPSTGKISFRSDDRPVPVTDMFRFISFCAPGMELVEELTLREFLNFHFSFKPILSYLTTDEIIKKIGLQDAADKPINDYSSGMKQRVKLAQAIFSDTPVLLLDEPCTNLDQQGVDQYKEWINEFGTDRLVIVASNDPREYFFCAEHVEIGKYK